MAISVTTDLTDVNLAEVTTNYLPLGTIATALAISPDTWIQSANDVGCRISAATGWQLTSTAAAVDLTISERHVFQWLKCISVPALDTKANGGMVISISSDVTPTITGTSPNDAPTNSKNWYVDGKDTASITGWTCYVVDPQSTPTVTNGTPVITGINRIGARAKVVSTVGGGAVKPVNFVMDATRYGTGLTYTGDNAGTPGAFADILTTAMSITNAWGILTSAGGIYFGSGKFDFGTTAQAATSSFKDIKQLFVWNNFPIAATFYAWRVRGAASFGTTFQLGDFNSGTGLVSNGCVVKGAAGAVAWTLDAGTNTTVNLYGSIFSEMRRGTLQSTSTVRGCTFQNIGETTPQGALIDSCTFQDVNTAVPFSGTWALIINATTDMNSKITKCNFINCNKAIKITAIGTYTFDALKFSGNTFDIENNSTGLVTINAINGANPVTVTNTGGGATTTINNSVTISITIKDAGTGTVIKNARVAVYKSGNILAGQELFNALSDVNGVASATFNFSTNQAIVIRARAETPLLGTPVNAAFSTATTGGSLVAGTYFYRVTATNDIGETLASVETSIVVPAGTSTNTVTVNWSTVTGATGYKIYGRTTGAELFIASVGVVTTYTDTGSITPAGALPTADTSGTTRYVAVDATGTITVNGFTATLTLVQDTIAVSTPL